jgi:hypothetical protein
MGALGFCGSLIYVLSVAAFIMSVVTIQWANRSVDGLTIKNIETDVDMQLGLFNTKSTIVRDGELAFSVAGYDWCEGGITWNQYGEKLVSAKDEDQLCYLLTATQVGAICAAAIGLSAALLAMMLSCGSIRRRSEKHVAGFTSSLMFFQTLCGAGAVATWWFLVKLLNRNVYKTYGFKLDMGYSWYLAVAASALAFVSFSISACTSNKMTFEDDEEPVFAADKKKRGGKSSLVSPREDYKNDEENARVIANTY